MNKIIISFFTLLLLAFSAQGQATFKEEIAEFQSELNAEFLNPEESPLTKKDRRKFKGHNFFPANEAYRVEAKFTKYENPEVIQMKTTTSRLSGYDVFGVIEFELKGQTFSLNVYQSHRLRSTEQYKDYLFLPFTDLTNGEETYGGGRYIDLTIPDGDTIIIDFNKAYVPSCAYNHGYSCPIPPADSYLDTRVEAGVKNLVSH